MPPMIRVTSHTKKSGIPYIIGKQMLPFEHGLHPQVVPAIPVTIAKIEKINKEAKETFLYS